MAGTPWIWDLLRLPNNFRLYYIVCGRTWGSEHEIENQPCMNWQKAVGVAAQFVLSHNYHYAGSLVTVHYYHYASGR